MKKYYEVLKMNPLFEGIKDKSLHNLINTLGVQINDYEKNQAIMWEGSPAEQLGIVLKGQVQVVKEDYYGNRSLLTNLGTGELFAEAFGFSPIETLPVSVIAAEKSTIMLISCKRLIASGTAAPEVHNRLVHNMMAILANKNLNLVRKIEIVSQRSTKEKLMAYLLTRAKLAGSNSFTIPLNRQQLADYLLVDRSAMSAELGKLQDSGLIEFQRSSFKLLKP